MTGTRATEVQWIALLVAILLASTWYLLLRPAPEAIRGPDPAPQVGPAEVESPGPETSPAPARAAVAAPPAPETGAGRAPLIGTQRPSGSELRGQLVDERGNPCANTELRFRFSDGSGPTTVTDARGRFAFLLPVRPGSLQLTDPDLAFAEAASSRAILASSARDLGRIVVGRRWALQLRIADEAGAPVEGAVVQVATFRSQHRCGEWSKDGYTGASPQDMRSDARGEVRLAGLELRFACVRVRHPGFLRHAEDVVRSEADPTSHFVTLRRGGTVSGWVQDDVGHRIAGAQVSLGGRRDSLQGETPGDSTRTDELGRFLLGGLGEGRTAVYAHAPGHQRKATWVRASQQGAVLILPRLATVAGRVRDEAGRPIARAEVILLRNRAESDAEGRFRIEHAEPGAQRLFLSAPGFANRLTEPVTIKPGSSTGDLELTLTRGVPFVVRVLDRQGRPPAKAWVVVEDGNPAVDGPRLPDGRHLAAAYTDADGRATMRVSGPMAVSVAVYVHTAASLTGVMPPHTKVRADCTVREGDANELLIRVP